MCAPKCDRAARLRINLERGAHVAKPLNSGELNVTTFVISPRLRSLWLAGIRYSGHIIRFLQLSLSVLWMRWRPDNVKVDVPKLDTAKTGLAEMHIPCACY
jgi:hypothetical protein